MIFATVGTQLPFDRLVSTLDQWASSQSQSEVFAQIGDSKYCPRYIQWRRFLQPEEYNARLQQASVIVAHAGIGSILSALELGKRAIIMPRMSKWGEHRNDHQLATARRFHDMTLVKVAFDEYELTDLLNDCEKEASVAGKALTAPNRLLRKLSHFIQTES